MELTGVIERRVLVSYRVDPDVLSPLLPSRFRLQLVEGAGVSGSRDETRPPACRQRWAGGSSPVRLRRADVRVDETDRDLRVAFDSRDGQVCVDVHVEVTPTLEGSALLTDVAASSAFFERGSVGYSGDRDQRSWDGFELTSTAWSVDPCRIVHARSSLFDALPDGAAELDSAVVMREVPVALDALLALV